MIEEWNDVATRLNKFADNPSHRGNRGYSLNPGQCASLLAIAERITKNGMVIADEVGMGKTCIAVELARSVVDSGGRVAILVPPGLGYQWQDELIKGNVNAPLILRSLSQYLNAWRFGNQQPWFQNQVVVISHSFTNWVIQQRNAHPDKWTLLPELYAQWRRRKTNIFPRNYRRNDRLRSVLSRNAACSICEAIPEDEQHPAWQIMNEVSQKFTWPQDLLNGSYQQGTDLKLFLQKVVGIGLGTFDLVIIDEAHKSRAIEKNLSRLINNVVLKSTNVVAAFGEELKIPP